MMIQGNRKFHAEREFPMTVRHRVPGPFYILILFLFSCLVLFEIKEKTTANHSADQCPWPLHTDYTGGPGVYRHQKIGMENGRQLKKRMVLTKLARIRYYWLTRILCQNT